MESKPLVSIIIPAYKAADYLREAIDSALRQTYPNTELLVINDGSPDKGETERIAQSYGDLIRYFYKPNGGAGSALNHGIHHMRGEFFSWLSHDDVYYPNKVERQVARFRELGRSDVILYSDFDLIDSRGNLITAVRIPEISPFAFRFRLAAGSFLHGCSLFVPRAAFDRCGLFDENLRTTQDYDLWFKMSFKYDFVQMRETLIQGRMHPGQGTRTMRASVREENNALLCRFLDGISRDELRAASGQALPLAYLSLARRFFRRGFRRAGRKALLMALSTVGPIS